MDRIAQAMGIALGVWLGSASVGMSQITPVDPTTAPTSPVVPGDREVDADSAESEDEFPPSQLELIEPDPLLPQPMVDRPLSPLERLNLSQALDDLNAQAQAAYQSGQEDRAFEIWFRELRLRRSLGYEDEILALGRVGGVAWRENRSEDVQVITERLQEIELELQAQSPRDFPLLLTLAQSYQSLRAVDQAIALYTQVLAWSREQNDTAVEQSTLVGLAELNLAWFRYAEAGSAYEELLLLARQRGDGLREAEYLEQLAFVYQRGRLPERAIPIQQQLAAVYRERGQLDRVAPVNIALANSYRATNRLDRAATTYQDAFVAARDQQQFGYASESLRELAELFKSINRPDDALYVYRALVNVEGLSYNVVGIMNAMDEMAQIHQTQGNTSEAIATYQQALEYAQLLDYATRANYYTEQIQQLSRANAPTQP
ncbi:tetratricopeptide repeat protein [Leptolyngbya sp. AN02str]|uniref:tetratricopeptide repeat protein n=1 Tax=Leptolyngbya sp. AN02str TaxID=3423363 RepID=UPI003D310792